MVHLHYHSISCRILIIGHPYHALTGELWVHACYAYFEENWPFYNRSWLWCQLEPHETIPYKTFHHNQCVPLPIAAGDLFWNIFDMKHTFTLWNIYLYFIILSLYLIPYSVGKSHSICWTLHVSSNYARCRILIKYSSRWKMWHLCVVVIWPRLWRSFRWFHARS